MKTISRNAVLCLVALAFTAACSTEEIGKNKPDNNPTEQQLTTFQTGEAPISRTTMTHTLNGPGKFFWTTGDNIFVDNGGIFVSSNTSSITNNTTNATFYFTGNQLTAPSYTVTYTGKGSTKGDEITIAAAQSQTNPNDFSHLGTSGDCGTATATRNAAGVYMFQIEHKVAYLCLLPRTQNALIRNFKVQSITVTAENDIAGTYSLSLAGLSSSPISNGSKSITLTTNNFALDASTSLPTNAAYIVIAPQVAPTALNITYKLHDAVTNFTGTITKHIPAQAYDVNKIYDLTANLNPKDYTEEVKPYMWDAKKWYYDGKTPPYTSADAPQSQATDPDRWYNLDESGTPTTHAQFSCKEIPSNIEWAWYLTGDPCWDAEEIWSANGKLEKGVFRFKRWSTLVSEYGASKSIYNYPSSAFVPYQQQGGANGIVSGATSTASMPAIPSPASFANYFMVPGPMKAEPAGSFNGYWSSTSKNATYAEHVFYMGWVIGVGSSYYIGTSRNKPHRAIKFE